MSFTPKFVDLVRNTTTTVGTDDFTLGAAMTGFTSFTAACQVGDCFYYSAIGIDKPSEREVGRGTLLDGGAIERDPISGVKTNFSNGTKAVSLIAAAEWFADVQSGAAAGPPMAASRAALAAATPQRVAVLSEGGREGLFMFNPANLSVRVAADAGQGIYVPATGDATGASGAWVRKYDGSVNVKWFGATGDGSTDDSLAFLAALAYLKAIAGNDVIQMYKASPKLFIPAGHYYLGTATLDISHTLVIEGEGGGGIGAGGGAATKLRWAANTTGIRVQYVDTSGASALDGSTHYSGGFSSLRQLYLYGGFQSGVTPEGEFHGVHAKATVFLDNVQIENFQGDALYAHTTSGAGNATEGASNGSRVYNCIFRNSRNGVSLAGGDANAWVFSGCSFVYNRACGVDDQSFLGNTYIHPHTNGNGITADNLGTSAFPAYVVSNGGNRYCPVQGQELAASTTPPSGTADTNVWLYLCAGGPGTGIPAWTSGISLRCAAPYRTNNTNACNLFLNPYEEGGQGLSQFTNPTIIQGGTHGNGAPKGSGVYMLNANGWLATYGMLGAIDLKTGAQNGLGTDRLEINHPTGGQQTLEWFNGDLCWTILRSGNPTLWSYQILGEATANPVGKRHINFPNGFGFNSKKVFPGTAPPTSGAWLQGDMILNSAPSAGDFIGWVCVSGGSPGTWKTFGPISP